MTEKLYKDQRFGAWIVLDDIPKKYKYKCLCTACGKSMKWVRVYDLTGGKTRMCQRCANKQANHSHGMSDSEEYRTWVHMNQRCHNPSNKDYENYGGRGIEVCSAWRSSFEAFYMSIGPRPATEYTIERLDYNKGYEPGNVKWATRQEQVLNKRDNVNLTINGETMAVSQWARHPDCPVSPFVIYKRVKRGWVEKYGAEVTVFSESRPD